MKRTEILLFVMLLAVLLPLELICGLVAYETLGEIASLGYIVYGSIIPNLFFIILAFKSRAWAAIGLFLVALAIIPYQVYLTHRLFRVQQEAANIVTFAYEEHQRTGRYPLNLSNYQWLDPEMKPFIQSYTFEDPEVSLYYRERGGFSLYYRVGTKDTSHSYSPRLGWGYYPD